MATDVDWLEIAELLAQSQDAQERVEEIERDTDALLAAAERGEFDASRAEQISAASDSVEAEFNRLLARIETLLEE